MSFADNAFSVGTFTTEWNTSRHTIVPTEGPGANQPIRLSGVIEMSGMGFTREGVNLVFGSDGSGRAMQITKGREKPNEISVKLNMSVANSTVAPVICPRGGTVYKFNYIYEQVDPAGVTSFSYKWTDCIVTGSDSDTPSDNIHADTLKFQPKRRA